MFIDFPASVHKNTYDNSLIAVDQDDYDRLYADGWRLSEDFLNNEDADPEPDQPVKRKRGRPPRTQE